MPEFKVEPEFTISEIQANQIAEKKIGQTFRGILNFKVIEKTKSYVVIRVGGVTPNPTKRIV